MDLCSLQVKAQQEREAADPDSSTPAATGQMLGHWLPAKAVHRAFQREVWERLDLKGLFKGLADDIRAQQAIENPDAAPAEPGTKPSKWGSLHPHSFPVDNL